MSKKVRYIYSGIILLLVVAAVVSYLYYRKQDAWYDAEIAGLQKIADDHATKVKQMENK